MTSCLPVWVPQYGGSITINGHQSKILVSDFHFGKKTLLYSTAEVLTYALFGDKEVIVLWLPEGEKGEFTVEGHSEVNASGEDSLELEVHQGESNVTISWVQQKGIFTLGLEDGTSILLVDRSNAYLFWVPTLDNDPYAAENNTGTLTK